MYLNNILLDSEYLKLLSKCKNYDFFSGDKDSFMKTVEGEPKLCFGKHKTPEPLISIIITTYKRPLWLKIALANALNQKDFDDYEVIVVDNEGVSVNIETETERVIKLYKSDKLIYYRHKYSVNYKTHSAIALSRSKYFCILHDDDIISRNHLRIMVQILRQNPYISYLSCSFTPFDTKNEPEITQQSERYVCHCGILRRYTASSAGLALAPGWRGALIDREAFINMGGAYGKIPLSTMIDDFVMQFKFMYRVSNIYSCCTDMPLYFYRISDSQASSSGITYWMKAYAIEYLFYKYVNKLLHPNLYYLLNFISCIILYTKIENLMKIQRWSKGEQFDLKALHSLVGLPVKNINSKCFFCEKKLVNAISKLLIVKSNLTNYDFIKYKLSSNRLFMSFI